MTGHGKKNSPFRARPAGSCSTRRTIADDMRQLKEQLGYNRGATNAWGAASTKLMEGNPKYLVDFIALH